MNKMRGFSKFGWLLGVAVLVQLSGCGTGPAAGSFLQDFLREALAAWLT